MTADITAAPELAPLEAETEQASQNEEQAAASALDELRAEINSLRSLREQLSELRDSLASAEQERRDGAAELNAKNAQTSSGGMGESGAPEHYTPAEVRAMSQGEVHKNYARIIESMKYWN